MEALLFILYFLQKRATNNPAALLHIFMEYLKLNN